MALAITKEVISKGTKGIFTSRLGMKFDVRVSENVPVGSTRIPIQYVKSRDFAAVLVDTVELVKVVDHVKSD
jgi:hypothetical protein